MDMRALTEFYSGYFADQGILEGSGEIVGVAWRHQDMKDQVSECLRCTEQMRRIPARANTHALLVVQSGRLRSDHGRLSGIPDDLDAISEILVRSWELVSGERVRNLANQTEFRIEGAIGSLNPTVRGVFGRAGVPPAVRLDVMDPT